MIQGLSRQLRELSQSLQTGIGLGLGLIFLTLIGLPSERSEQLAALSLPLFLLISFGFGWSIVRPLPLDKFALVARNSFFLGLSAAVVLLLFLGQINRWHGDGISVSRQYFDAMNEYPIHVLSGVPEEELFPNPAINPITNDYDEGVKLRTNPMALYFSEEHALISVGGFHIGGLFGLAILLSLAALLGGFAQNIWQRVDWSGVVKGYHQIRHSSIWHWTTLSSPLIFFALYWLSIPQKDDSIHLLPLKELLNLGAGSLIDEVSIQLGLSFLIIITALVAMRQARMQTSSLHYVLRVGIGLSIILGMMLLAIFRIQGDNVTFIAPSVKLFDLSGHDYSLILTVLIGLGLAIYTLSANRNPANFETSYTILLAATTILMSPLYMDQYQSFIMGRVGLSVMFGLGLNIVIGYAGLLDLGYVAFYAIGAYTFAFLAIENDRSKVPLEQLNDVGWFMVTAMIFAPLILFALTNAWQMFNRRPEEVNQYPQLKRQSQVWNQQPPWYVAIWMIVLAVLVIWVVQQILTRAGIFEVSQFSSFFIATFVAMMVAAFTGVALGIPILRLRGDYLAIVTLGFGEIISLGLKNLDTITGGPSGAIGVPKPVALGTGLPTTNLVMLYLSLVGSLLVIALSVRLRNSRIGRAWMAMHSDEDIAQAMGINLVNVKLLAFSIGASFAGLAGMLFASRQNSIFPDDFGLEISINVLSLVIIGGMGSIPGVVIGSIVLIGLPELLRPIQDYRIMLFGLLLIVTMVVLPAGLMPSPPPSLEDEARRLAEEEARKNI